ncbi:MAG TPA: DNA repair protein RecO [Verrucomicrobiae bacterium]|nr:DNA repair protein RecO [Verrucomicrobiae bacterium]
MIESAHGIVLRTRLLTETSLIVHWLTPKFGRIATVAKGARRPKSLFVGKLDLFYEADFSFSRSRSSDLHHLREVNLRGTHAPIRQDILKLQQAAYAAHFIEQATETEAPLPEIFGLLCDFLKFLCEQKTLPQNAPQNIFVLELKLLRELGLEPDFAESHLTPGAKKFVELFLETDWTNLARLKLAKPQIIEIRQWLHGFLIFHLGKLPRGRNAALAS